MKTPKKFTIADYRLPIAGESGDAARNLAPGAHPVAANRHSSFVIRHSQCGIALVITLIMLSVTLVMALAFLALAKRERGSVSTNTDNIVAQNAAQAAVAHAQAQIVANILNGFNGLGSSNAYNLHLLVSTNYTNPQSVPGLVNPTNVNYFDANGNLLTGNNLMQNIENQYFLPRAPVFVPTNQPQSPPAYDFRFYLDLNENGTFDPNGWQTVISKYPSTPYYETNGILVATFNPQNVLSNFFVGDPEWIGVLEHPDAPHGPNNHFTSRYAFIAVPAGNALDFNYIHNDAYNVWHNQYAAINPKFDGFIRNQGVGSWELNLAAFLADLNTNEWDSGSLGGVYDYRTPLNPNNFNDGSAFYDASSLLAYRYGYNYNMLANASVCLANGNVANYPYNIDLYGDGPLQTTFDTNAALVRDIPSLAWSGAFNTNHLFSLGDFFDLSKLGPFAATFTNHLRLESILPTVNGQLPSYDRYTFYRMLDQIATDSSADDGRLNLNYCNALVTNIGKGLTINIIPGAETNLVPWGPTNFFLAAADQLLRAYTTNWLGPNGVNYPAFTNTFGVGAPFTVTNIPVWVSNRFVYAPSVNRLLQLAANIYDASTNSFFPDVFRPVFERDASLTNIFIASYVAVGAITEPGVVPPFDLPIDPSQLSDPAWVNNVTATYTPILDKSGFPVNVYGVPWIIGAKKRLPNFNKFGTETAVQIARKLQITRRTLTPTSLSDFTSTNQLYEFTISNSIGMDCWNSYSNAYPDPVVINVRDTLSMWLTNNYGAPPTYFAGYVRGTNFVVNPGWPGTTNIASSFVQPMISTAILLTNSDWYFGTAPPGKLGFWPDSFNLGWETKRTTFDLPQFGLLTTNRLQLTMLDYSGGRYHVIDYVQLAGPQSSRSLNSYFQSNSVLVSYDNMWATNVNAIVEPIGIANQIYISEGGVALNTTYWNNPPVGSTKAQDEIDGFREFMGMAPMFNNPGAANQAIVNSYNSNYVVQVPYTPTATIYDYEAYEANDPLVHYLASDLTYVGADRNNNPPVTGMTKLPDNNTGVPQTSFSTYNDRYLPWGVLAPSPYQSAVYNFANSYDLKYKDPLMWSSDGWDFPTNRYPSVGWLGRVHRGTPWQTVYLKAHSVLSTNSLSFPFSGTNTWMKWSRGYSMYGIPDVTAISAFPSSGDYNIFDAANTAPLQDRLLFDVFTARLSDNAVRGELPVNVGAGQTNGGLAAWSALFSGMVALTNTTFYPFPLTLPGFQPGGSHGGVAQPGYGWLLSQPAGAAGINSTLGSLVTNINNTRFNFTNADGVVGVFEHAGDVLSAPLLSEQSPFLNWTNVEQQQTAISDELYEWLPQQMMGLVRGTEPRYVLYCYGQTLRPAPGGTVLSGSFFQLVTNYQVVAESVVRAVIRVDGANTSQPHAVVESYNVLPQQ